MKTRLEIIDETVKYYRTHKRSFNDVACLYYHRGAKCAIGRLLENPKEVQSKMSGSVADGWHYARKYAVVKKGYEAINDEAFGTDLQDLHDYDDYWVKKGKGQILSLEGRENVKKLKNLWRSGS